MQSTNPVLRRHPFQEQAATGERMTVNGTVGKTALLLVLAVITGAWTWHRFAASVGMQHWERLRDLTAGSGHIAPAAQQAMQVAASEAMGSIAPFMWGGIIVGFILVMVSVFKPRWSGIVAPLYALAEGLALGGISAFMELRYPGVVLQAVMLTAAVMAMMLVAYRAGWIRVTDKFRTCVMVGTGAIMLLYLVEIGMRVFGAGEIPYIHESGIIGIGFSLLVVGLAALFLVLDFDMIDQGVTRGAPKYMEWHCALALMVTLVWLYMEILQLLGKLRN